MSDHNGESASQDRTRRWEQADNVPGETPSARLRALLARSRPLTGNDIPDVYWAGRSLIENLALAYEAGTDYDWSRSQCATVLNFLGSIQPTEGNCICNDESEVNATCGLHVIYEYIAERLIANTLEPATLLEDAARAATNSSRPHYNEATAEMKGSPDALNALLNVAGSIRLAREVVLRETGTNEYLAAAEGVLVLAEREAERVYTWLEAADRAMARNKGEHNHG